MRIPVRYKVLKTTLPLSTFYKCEHCGKENRFIHYLESTTPAANKFAEEENRKNIENNLKKYMDSKNPEIYPELLISHQCQYCEKAPSWAAFKQNTFESAAASSGLFGMILAFILMLIVATTNIINLGSWVLLLAISPLFIVPAIKYFVVAKKNEKALEKLKELSPEYFPTFKLTK